MKLNKIVVATDFSSESLRPLESVKELSRRIEAEVTLLHAIPTLTPPVVGGFQGTLANLPDYEAEQAQANLELEQLESAWEGSVSHHVAFGPRVPDTIADYVESSGADLLALATHGRTGVRRLVMGSIAESVLRASEVPVLCFPPSEDGPSTQPGFSRILFPTDLSAGGLRPLASLLDFAEAIGSEVIVLHVVPVLRSIPYGAPFAPMVSPPDTKADLLRAQQELSQLCSALGGERELRQEVIGYEERASGILDFASKNGVDLIALSSHKRRGIQRVALGSVMEAVLRSSPIPVLSFPRSAF